MPIYRIWSKAEINRYTTVKADDVDDAHRAFDNGEIISTWDVSEDPHPVVVDCWVDEDDNE